MTTISSFGPRWVKRRWRAAGRPMPLKTWARASAALGGPLAAPYASWLERKNNRSPLSWVFKPLGSDGLNDMAKQVGLLRAPGETDGSLHGRLRRAIERRPV